MRAVVTEDFGSAPRIIDLDLPELGATEIRVRVRASSLNGFDLALAGGYFNGILEHRFPVTLGRDFAGTVDAVGSEVRGFSAGDDVFGVVPLQPLHVGGFAEYVIVGEQDDITRVPAGLDLATAGALGLAGAAALAVTAAVSPAAGQTVLVAGATGGVGAIAVQMLNAAGVRVIATASGEVEAAHVRSLGAAEVVDGRTDVVEQVRAIAPEGVDAVIHLAGDPVVLGGLVADGGHFGTLLMADPAQPAERNVTVAQPSALPRREVLDALAGDVVAGRLRLPVQRTFSIDEVPDAIAAFAAGTLGKVAISIP